MTTILFQSSCPVPCEPPHMIRKHSYLFLLLISLPAAHPLPNIWEMSVGCIMEQPGRVTVGVIGSQDDCPGLQTLRQGCPHFLSPPVPPFPPSPHPLWRVREKCVPPNIGVEGQHCSRDGEGVARLQPGQAWGQECSFRLTLQCGAGPSKRSVSFARLCVPSGLQGPSQLPLLS